MIRMFVRYFLKIFILSVIYSKGLCIAKWYMHSMCRRFLFDYGGELVLDESLFPRHQDSCFITIVGNGTQHNRISFFFSSFYVGSDCQGNVTLVDGIADIYTRTVPGLEKSLCKYDNLDERSMFETKERYLGILFHRRRDRWRTSSNVSLTLKFVSFHDKEEPCDPEDTGKLYSCPNGRCVNNDVLCRDLNPCGDFSNSCDESGIQQTTTKVILSTSKYIIIGVGVFVGFLCLAQGCFIVRRCCSKSDDSDEIIEKSYKKTTEDVPPDIHKEDKLINSDENDQTILDDSLAEESIHLVDGDTDAIESDSETKYVTDSEKGSFEDVNCKPDNVIETCTELKRTFV